MTRINIHQIIITQVGTAEWGSLGQYYPNFGDLCPATGNATTIRRGLVRFLPG